MTLSDAIKQVTAVREVDWDAVYAEQLPRVYNFFRYRVGVGPLAEDLTAATFEKAWRERARYRHDVAAFSTWLFTIARNVAIDHLRQYKRERSLDDVLLADDTLEATVQRRSDHERLTALLRQLPPRERELIALKYGADLTNRAIAELTGLSESNVGTIMQRTVRRLGVQWGHEHE